MPKRRIAIPNLFEVQIQNELDENLNFENILCHLNIHISESSYYTYSFIPSNSDGKIVLTKQKIIQNTGLRHYYDPSLSLENESNKFDLSVIDKNLILSFISSLKMYLNIKPEEIRRDLSRRGFKEPQIIKEIPKVLAKQEEDKLLYDLLVKNKNSQLEYSEIKSKIEGVWKDDSNVKSTLKLRL